jgi:hypothetical protein
MDSPVTRLIPAWHTHIIKAVENGNNIINVAASLKIGMTLVTRVLNTDPEFKKRMDVAKALASKRRWG